MLKITKETMFADFTFYTARYDRAVGKGDSAHKAVADWISNSNYTVKMVCVEWTDFKGFEQQSYFTDYASAAARFDELLSTGIAEYATIVGYSDDTMYAECVELADSRTWGR